MAATMLVDVHLSPADVASTLRADVATGLASSPKWLPPKWFYDDRGSALFDEITRLPEYYPTRREREILDRHAADVAALAQADTLVELGSGTSEKTLLLLDALDATGDLRSFVPLDVSEATMRGAAERIDARYPGVEVHGVVGDFERHLHLLPDDGRRLVAFLGGTIGNLDPVDRARFLCDLGRTLRPGEHLLLGTDLVKDVGRLIAAYDDTDGVTAEFNRNVLHVVNRELDGDIDVSAFSHMACWNEAEERIEMWLCATRSQVAHLGELGTTVRFRSGEGVRTELSCKFRPAGIAAELSMAGFGVVEQWTDAAGDFAVTLARRS